MSEYISRDAAINKIMENIVHQDCHDANLHNIGLRKAMSAIDSLPAADVVEVVRCRECEFTYEWHGRLYCKRLRDRWNHVNDRLVDDTDFCTWGKHKDGGQDDA